MMACFRSWCVKLQLVGKSYMTKWESRAPVQLDTNVINIINMKKAHVETQQYMLQ